LEDVVEGKKFFKTRLFDVKNNKSNFILLFIKLKRSWKDQTVNSPGQGGTTKPGEIEIGIFYSAGPWFLKGFLFQMPARRRHKISR